MPRRVSWMLVVPAVLLGVLVGRARPDEAGDGRGIDFRKIVRDAKDRVFPAVVYVKCIQETHEGGKRESQQVGGSGVIISKEGEFLTNWHVVEKATEVRCMLFDGQALHAEVVGSDKDTDLALCRLKPADAAATFPLAVLGDSDALVEGDFVMAMGAPWGMSRSVSIGIVACTRRYLPGNSEYSLWVQTDCSISPGNSGGPLVNTRGEVVGINSRGIMYGGDMGFAIPSSTIRLIAEQLRAHGAVAWSWTGLQLQPLRDFDKDMYFEGNRGVIVAGTDADSPARRAGILPQDRLLSADAAALDAVTAEDLPAVQRTLGLLPKEKPARVRLRRGAEEVEVSLVPREKGAVEGAELACARWDFSAKTINQFDNPDLYLYRKQGVFVFGVKSPGNADDAGFAQGDILLKIGTREVASLDDLKAVHKAAIERVQAEHRLVFTILRNGLQRQVVLDFARDYERE